MIRYTRHMHQLSSGRVDGVRIAYERCGSGFPILLLHGWPQTRRMWRHVAPALARRFTVVTADLRGYGDSDPADDPDAYDKRTMAEDMLALMDELGFPRFLAVGHDRGARAVRRMAADHPDRLVGGCLLDIMPMEWVFNQGKDGYARRYYHWYFFLQRGLAEAVVAAAPRPIALHQFAGARVSLDGADVEHYVEMFSRPHSIQATLGDYRTAFEVDRPRWEAALAEDERIAVPLQILWGGAGNLRDAPILDEWRRRAEDVRGRAIEGSAHYIPEEQPDQVVRAIVEFADELGLP
ncbi:MAG: alpha/beta hydrolase [Chloroflexi bacterium]|nr:alpha/beta hydrolase [Chloroflexota bacterium]